MCRSRVRPLPPTNEQLNLLTTSPNVDEERDTSCVIDHGRVDDDDGPLSEQVVSLRCDDCLKDRVKTVVAVLCCSAYHSCACTIHMISS